MTKSPGKPEMQCPACGSAFSAGDSYCSDCGTALYALCTHCQSRNRISASFCVSCGQELQPARRKAERKIVTVLFADMVDSTSFIGDADPEGALSHLSGSLALMRAAVEPFGGLVVRTMGDGLLALFGVPKSEERHALLACQAAMKMQAAFSGENGYLRVGLHSGEVVAEAASDPSGESDVYGGVVHMAHRLEQMAAPGEIFLSEDTVRLVKPFCDVLAVGPRVPKGFRHPVTVYRLLGTKLATTSEQFLEVSLAPFRGREREMTTLRQALARAGEGAGGLFGISGPPGIGKSRLCFEFAEAARRALISVIEARASPYERPGPLQPLLEFLRAYFDIHRNDDTVSATRKIKAKVEAVNPLLKDHVAIFADVLGLRQTTSPPNNWTAAQKQSRLTAALQDLARGNGRDAAVIVVEDVHMMDEGSRGFIADLAKMVAGSHTLLLLTYRPEGDKFWRSLPGLREIVLGELDIADSTAIVESLVGTTSETQWLRTQIAERCGGSPFFAEELIRSLVDQHLLVGEPSRYSLGAKTSDAALPSTVQSVIGARIDRLDDTEKAILQIGSTIGREFPQSVLEEVSGIKGPILRRKLENLCRLEIVSAKPDDDRGAIFSFRHPLIQEVAYASQLRRRRAELHAKVARAIESFHKHKGRLDEYGSLVSRHYEAAGEFGNAARYAMQAAFWLGTTHSREALNSWRRVLHLLEHEPKTKASDQIRVVAGGQVMNLGWRHGLTAHEAAPIAEYSLRLARESGDTTAEILLLAAYGRLLVGTGSADDYVASLESALARSSSDSRSQRALLHAFLCHGYGLSGRLREALRESDLALSAVGDIEPWHGQLLGFDVQRWVTSQRARILVRMGDLGSAKGLLDDLIATEDKLLDPAVRFIPYLAYVELAWLTGDHDLARRYSRRVVDLSAKSELPYLAVYAGTCRGLTFALGGDFQRAVRQIEAAIETARSASAGLEFEPEMLAYLAEVHRRAGNVCAAAEQGWQAVEAARRRAARLAECRALITISLIGEDGSRYDTGDVTGKAKKLVRETGAAAYAGTMAQLAFP